MIRGWNVEALRAILRDDDIEYMLQIPEECSSSHDMRKWYITKNGCQVCVSCSKGYEEE